MNTTNNNIANYTVENLVAKYREYVKVNGSGDYVEYQDKNGLWHDEWAPLEYLDAERQLLVTIYKNVVGDNVVPSILDALSKYAEDFHYNALDEKELSFLVEHFPEVSTFIFDYWGDETNSQRWNYGFERPSQKAIDFLGFDPSWWNYSQNQPSTELQKEVQETVIKPGMTIFIANSGYCDIAMQFPNCTIKGFTHHKDNRIDKEVWALGQIRLYAAGIKSEILPCVEDIKDWQYMEDVDYAIWGSSYHSSYERVEQFYQHMRPNSKLLLFLDKNDAAGDTRYESKDLLCLRKRLVEEKSISTIISFEEFDNYIEINRLRICVFAEKVKNDSVLVKNSDSGYEMELPSHMLDAEILWPSYYMTLKPKDGIALSEIVSFHDLGRRWEKGIDRDLIIERENGEWKLSDKARAMSVVRPADMAIDYKDANLCEAELKMAGDAFFEKWIGWLRKIEKTCVLLYGKNEKFVVGYINRLPDSSMATLDSVVCLIPKKGIDVRYVAALLLTPEVRNQIMSICEGEINDIVFPLIMDKIMIPNHSEKERLSFLAEANYNAMLSSQKELKQEHVNYTKAVRMRKHALTQKLFAMKATFSALNAYRNRQNGQMSENDRVVPIKETTVRDAFELISKDIEVLRTSFEHIADVEYTFSKPEWINPEQFIEDYISKNTNEWLNFKPVITWEKGHNSAKENLKDTATGEIILKKGDALNSLYFPKDALEKVMNNIVANATSHGFTERERNDYQLRFSWHSDGIAIIIEIENNGKPIPSDRNTASLLEYGVSTALHKDGHNGIGCNEIDDIMRRYDGKVKIESSPESDFTVKYVLTFERSNIIRQKNIEVDENI